ncbi:hypothetical protein H4Q26_015160 [Puccinia striiformis f. sp. tritici PST-130]|nr:hypothetical protein H4Q26_015160 [Puccinia striiformis f. sp. tritici PST-130]
MVEDINRKVAELDPRQDPPATIQDLESRQKMIHNEITNAKPIASENNNNTQDSKPDPTNPDSQSSDNVPKPEDTHSKDEL